MRRDDGRMLHSLHHFNSSLTSPRYEYTVILLSTLIERVRGTTHGSLSLHVPSFGWERGGLCWSRVITCWGLTGTKEKVRRCTNNTIWMGRTLVIVAVELSLACISSLAPSHSSSSRLMRSDFLLYLSLSLSLSPSQFSIGLPRPPAVRLRPTLPIECEEKELHHGLVDAIVL
ncbi:hypothetical protein LZ31DRAFT_376943 [Colletotrichum somersetense]|nr:hypothetical protein LZ31DRAFT_376943 [Colletotrichum somersetense]